MDAHKIHIFTAIRAEARAMTRLLPPGAIPPRVIGIRARLLPEALPSGSCDAIIMAGVGGALDPALRIGDVVIDAPAEISVQPPYRRGRIHTAEQIIGTPAEKASLFASTGALAVDMENSIARAMATRLGVPFIGIRAISDTAHETLDPAVLRFIDEAGRLRPIAVAGTLLRRPALIPSLRLLGKNSALALKQLAIAVDGIVRAFASMNSPTQEASTKIPS